MEPTVGIIASETDLHSRVIQRRLEERHGMACHLIPGRQLATVGGLSWCSDADAPSVLPTTRGDRIQPALLNALWCRRMPRVQALPPGADEAYAAHVNRDTEAALMGLLLNEFAGRWVSHPEATDRAENKLLQLRVAQQVGLRVPRTLVSQDPLRIRQFVASEGEVILKAVRPRGEAAETALVTAELLENDEVLSLSPTIYQQCIGGRSHLRVMVLEHEFYATRIDADRLDWRLDLNVPFVPVPLDPVLSAHLCEVLERLGLVMGIFDLKIDEAGEPVFLEVNPQGQFLFVEGLSGLGLADAVADFLAEHAVADFRLRSSRLEPATMVRTAV